MEVPDKSASPESSDASGKDGTHTKAQSNGAPKESKKNTPNTDDNAAGESQPNILAEADIKKEIVTDEDGSDYETDDDATDDGDYHKLVIDESLKAKPTSDESKKSQSKKKETSSNGAPEKESSIPLPESKSPSKKTEVKKPPKKAGNQKPSLSKGVRMPLKVKIVRKNKPVMGAKLSRDKRSLSKDSSLMVATVSTEQSTPGTSKEHSATPISRDLNVENSAWLVPFDLGWRREVVFRGTSEPSPRKKPQADIYYFGPCGSKLRSMPEISNYLQERGIQELSLGNFTFIKTPIHHPPHEVTRQAQQRGFPGSRQSTGTPAKTPKPKKVTQRVVPAVVTDQETTPRAPDVASPATPSTPTENTDSGIISTKRWRKRKALPPDFVSTDQALSYRPPKEQPPSPPHTATPTGAAASPPAQPQPLPSPPQSSPSAPLTPKAKRQSSMLLAAKSVTEPAVITSDAVTNSHTAMIPDTEGKEKELPKRVIKRKVLSPPETFITPLKKRKVLPAPIRRTSESASEIPSVSPPEKNQTNKVVFTFSRMGSVPTSVPNKGTFTLVRVNPIQNPCTLSCPGLQGQVPDFPCSVCLLLFHSQCVGTKKDFVCQRCQKQTQVQPVSTVATPATTTLTNGDANHVASPAVIPEEVVYADKMNMNNYDDQMSGDEQLDEIDLASDDDDDNFLTMTPEVVMASPVSTAPKVLPNSIPTSLEKQTVFIPPLPPLVRAPTLPNRIISPTGATVYHRLPPLGKPPALIRPAGPLSPPFGAASSQLRTLVSQIPPRQIAPQTTTLPITSTIATVLPTVLGTNVTQIITPIVPTPSVPVNILPNSAPIVVGTQILTPVSISMPGIAKGTVIYTNNPTLRFLLPSSGGMQTFLPNKPVLATPPVEAAVPPPPIESAVTTTTPAVSSAPIVSTVETSVTVTSKFLVQKPPLVINTRGKSICELVLVVGKAEKGQKVTFVDQEHDPEVSEQVSEANCETENQPNATVEESKSDDKAENDPNKEDETGSNVAEKVNGVSTEVTSDVVKDSVSVSTDSCGDVSKEPSENLDTKPSSDNVKLTGEENTTAIGEAESSMKNSNNSQLAGETVVDKNTEQPMDVDQSGNEANGCNEVEKSKETDVLVNPDNATNKEVIPRTGAEDGGGDNSGVCTMESTDAALQDPASSAQDSNRLPSSEENTVDKNSSVVTQVENLTIDETKNEQTKVSKETSEKTPMEIENSTASKDLTSDKRENLEVDEEIRPFSPLFTEEELNDWDRESVSSNDDEEEYRPTTPVLLCTQPYEDGYTRIRSTALTNRGAQLSCPADKCARVSCYLRPVTDLYADQEHAYCSPRGRQLFKQAGRKNMMTLKPPRRAFQQLLSACDALSSVFDYLSTADLLRASTVCRTWRKLASQPHHWATVKLKGLKVNNWKTCVKNLEFYGTTMLDMHGFEQEDSGWHQFLAHIHHLRKLQGLVFGAVPAWVLQAVAISLPQLLCLEAEYIQPIKRLKDGVVEEQRTQIDIGWLSSLLHLTVLRIRAPNGMTCSSFSPCGSFKALSNLTSLTHLSLTSICGFSSSDGAFLESLPHLQVLELGQCKEWRDQAFQRLGKLRSLRRLRLEMGGKQGDRGLANALSHMNRLEELTLLSFKITTSLAASIRRLKHLWHLTIWPDMETEGAMVVYNTLQAVRSLKKLQSFSWGIIFTEKTNTRYSKKSTKYREAVDVDEWWSDELRQGHRAKSIKIPLLKAFSDEASAPTTSKGNSTPASNSMEQGLIGVGHLKHKLSKCLPDVEIYVYQVPETLLEKVYGTSR